MRVLDRDLLLLHGGFTLLAVLVLAVPLPVATGWRVLALVLFYDVAVAALAWTRGDWVLRSMVAFIWPLSIYMLMPDWFLSSVLKILVFPDDGAPRLDTIPIAMGGMWAIPLLGSTWLGWRVSARRPALAIALSAMIGMAIFVGSEAFAPALGLWQPRDVHLVGGVAVYVLVPEFLLALGCAWLWWRLRDDGIAAKVGAALGLAMAYLGALCVSYGILG